MDFLANAGKLIQLASHVGHSLAEISTSPELKARIDRIPTHLGPYGVDPFGFDPQYVKKISGFAAWVYHNYFRVETKGVQNIPDGKCLVIGNHSGQLPFDAAMITAAAFLEREPPRFLRSMIERFVPATPFVSSFMARCGHVLGTPENCRRLLDASEAILAFPEGVRGLNKTYKHRYKLQRFGQGFMRLALEANAPIVPTVVVGAEEQSPSFYDAKLLGKIFGLPAFPITPTHPLVPVVGMLPYPTKYYIYFGEPMQFSGDANDEDAAIQKKVEEVRTRMQEMLDEGLKNREHVFW